MRAQEVVTMARAVDASENTGPTQISTTTILLVLATVFVILRFWARHYVAAQYGPDDWLIVAGLVSCCSPMCDEVRSVLTQDRQVSVFVIGGLNYGSKDTMPLPNGTNPPLLSPATRLLTLLSRI